MTPTEAVAYLCDVYARQRMPPPMRRFYEAALAGLAPTVVDAIVAQPTGVTNGFTDVPLTDVVISLALQTQ